MRRLLDALGSRRWLLAAPVLLGSVFLVAGRPEPVSAEADTAGFDPMILIPIVVVGVALVVFLLNLAGRDPSASDRAAVLSTDPLPHALMTRWLQRSRHFRFVGGTVGAILSLGFVDGNLLVLFTWVLAGVAAGGVAAEAHSLRGARRSARRGARRGADRVAELRVRRLTHYASRTDLVGLALIAVGATTLAAVALVGTGDLRAVGFCVAAVTTVVATIGFQHLVAVRARPSLPDRLREADDLLRRLAATQGFARPAIALGVALVGFAFSHTYHGTGAGVALLALTVLAWAWSASSWQSRSNLVAALDV